MMRRLELLAPAANADVAREAILHGADAVYIGASSHGARKSAANPVEDIAALVEFAHTFRARVYVTVNTLVYESELREVERLINSLWRVGVDALIVQDMGILRLDIPPIELHASTQCDTRTVEKARFLEEAGFSQIVLARELSRDTIAEICRSVKVPVECFIHGALCVSYSGRCSASCAVTGRSANRGECSQMCRMPYDLTDANGNRLARGRHILSLKDLNLSDRIPELIGCGVSSFKIEGRLKDAGYVKNVTAAYRRIIDAYIASHPDEVTRSSCGVSEVDFDPVLEKSFNRGFTHYFFDSARPKDISCPLTPKSMGERIDDVRMLNNGDGISFVDGDGIYTGVNVNRVDGRRIVTARPVKIPRGAEIRRTYDRVWQQKLAGNTASRKISVDVSIDEKGLTARDERGVAVRLPLPDNRDVARKPFDPRPVLSKLGNTHYKLRNLESVLPPTVFFPPSAMTALRNKMTSLLDAANRASYPLALRRKENVDYPYPGKKLVFSDNVANSLAEKFYRDHGVSDIQPAMETNGVDDRNPVVMTTRHCLLREMGMCKKEGHRVATPLVLTSGGNRFTADFDCLRCEMVIRLD